jgi:hypothetical protein
MQIFMHFKLGYNFMGLGILRAISYLKCKKVIWIIIGVNKPMSYRQIFKDYSTLTVPSLYILEVVHYIKSQRFTAAECTHLWLQCAKENWICMLNFAIWISLGKMWWIWELDCITRYHIIQKLRRSNVLKGNWEPFCHSTHFIQ